MLPFYVLSPTRANLALQPLATIPIVQLLHQKRVVRLALGLQFAIRRLLLLLALFQVFLN